MEPSTGIKTWQWVVTVIVIIALIILGYNMFKGSSTPSPSSTIETPEETTETGDVNRVVVSDQFPGNIVYISSVQLAKPGWVEIHKDNNGTPGAIIGSMYFDSGTHNGKITLTSPTVDGGTYYAMLHSDDGDQKFDVTKDLPLKNAAGNVIMQLFHASASAMELKG